MPVIPAQTLFSESKCYNCYGELTTGENIILALWRRVVLSVTPTADVSPQGLVAYAKCYLCFTEGSMFDAMEMALMDLFFQSCGVATNSITVAGAGTPTFNIVYTKVNDSLWQNGIFSLVKKADGVWEMRRNASDAYALPVTEPFPCGNWVLTSGLAPAPTANYS